MISFVILCSVTFVVIASWWGISSYSKKKARNQSISEIPNIEKRESHFNLIDKWVKEDMRFTDPQIKLETVSKGLHLTDKQVSTAVNTIACQNFKSYINKLRVLQAKSLLVDPSYKHFTVEAFAEMVGFSNKVSFYQSFKRVTGMSPSDFRKSQNH